MQQLLKILRFASWPIIYGLLVAIVYLQYQKLSELSQQVAEMPEVRELLTNTTSFAEAIRKAAPSVVSINATSVNVESVERAAEDRVNLYLGERDSLGSGVIIPLELAGEADFPINRVEAQPLGTLRQVSSPGATVTAIRRPTRRSTRPRSCAARAAR